jgi:hypothetical protein
MIEDPTKVLIPIEDMEWNPEVPVSEALKRAKEALADPPESIEFKVTLTGTYASRLHFIKTILTSLGMPDHEADKYLLQCGIEYQLRKLSESVANLER